MIDGELIELSSTDTVTDLDGTVPVPWNVQDTYPGAMFVHDASTNNTRVAVKAPCRVQIEACVVVTSATVNSAPFFRIRVNGSTYVRGRSTPGLMLNSSGNSTTTALWLRQEIDVAAVDDYLELVTGQDGASGAVNLVAEESFWRVRQIR